jgi:hypothetical protein
MTIEGEENSLMPLSTIAKFATCDPCLKRLGRSEPKPSAPAGSPQTEMKLPYKDS